MKSLSKDQELAIKAMANRQLVRFPETRFNLTSRSTYAEHPACGGGTKLHINRNTAISLEERGICIMNEKEDKVWLSPGALQLVGIGKDMSRGNRFG